MLRHHSPGVRLTLQTSFIHGEVLARASTMTTLPHRQPLRDLPDRILRDSLQHPDNLRALVEAVVPDLAPGFDFSRLNPLEREFPLDDWRRRESDLAFEVPFRSGAEARQALVFVLIEHQSGSDPWMPLRLLYAVVLYWERHWKRWEDAAAPKPSVALPPVLPIVLHTGLRPWDTHRSIRELMADLPELHPFVPAWQPLFWHLRDHTPEQLLSSTREWLHVLGVLRARDEAAERFAQVFAEAVRQLQPLCHTDHRRWYDLLRILLTWVAWRRPRPERQALTDLAAASQTEAARQVEIEQMSSQLGQTLEEWMQEREQLAELRTTRRLLVALLTDRFGQLPEDLAGRIEASADLERLQAAVRGVYRIRGLEELQL
jgi:hypothetical protein